MTRRMLDSSLFEDDFIGSLSFFGRCLWIGLFTAVVDDQGRCQDNPAIIRAHVFPFDTVSDEQVEAVLVKMCEAGKIIRYSVGIKRLIQVASWWEYQDPSWAVESKHAAPQGWVDRIRYHAKGNKIITENWDSKGGLINEEGMLPSALPSGLPIPLPSGLDSGIEKSKRREEESKRREEERREEKKQPVAVVVDISSSRPLIFSVYEREIGMLTAMIADQLKDIERDYPEEWFEMACKEAALHNKRNLAYVIGILKNWKVSGVGGARQQMPAAVPKAAAVVLPKPKYDTSELDALISLSGGA